MKRDARIGLAVVLVLGLAVTLLIGRAIHKRAELAREDGEPAAPGGTAQYSAEPPRVDGANSAQISSAPAQTPAVAPQPAETAARPQDPPNPALDKFLQDQTRRLPAGNPPVSVPGEKASAAEPAAANTGAKPAAGTTGNNVPPAVNNEDHENNVPPAAEPQPTDGYGYTVAAGDNMWKISTKVYGDGKFTQKIKEANPGLNTQKLKPGTVVRIPLITHKTILMKLPSFAEAEKELASAHGANGAANHKSDAPAGPAPVSSTAKAPEKAPADAATATVHKVEAGETLSAIAKKYYGANGPKTIALLTAANKGLDPAKLKVGQELTIPPKK